MQIFINFLSYNNREICSEAFSALNNVITLPDGLDRCLHNNFLPKELLKISQKTRHQDLGADSIALFRLQNILRLAYEIYLEYLDNDPPVRVITELFEIHIEMLFFNNDQVQKWNFKYYGFIV